MPRPFMTGFFGKAPEEIPTAELERRYAAACAAIGVNPDTDCEAELERIDADIDAHMARLRLKVRQGAIAASDVEPELAAYAAA